MKKQITRQYMGLAIATSIAIFTAGTTVAVASGSVVSSCQQVTGEIIQTSCVNVASYRAMTPKRTRDVRNDKGPGSKRPSQQSQGRHPVHDDYRL